MRNRELGIDNGLGEGDGCGLTGDGPKAIAAPASSHDGQMFHMFSGAVGRPHRVHSPAAIFRGWQETPDGCEGTTGAGRTPCPMVSIERAATQDIVALINERAEHKYLGVY